MNKWLFNWIEKFGAVVFMVAAVFLTLVWVGALFLWLKDLV
jgi:hypothetical protein